VVTVAFFGLIGNDRAMATEQYAGRESASEKAQRKAAKQSAGRVARHHRSGATRAARRGQAWEDADRQHEQYGRHGRR
jgi:hypothetical protein